MTHQFSAKQKGQKGVKKPMELLKAVIIFLSVALALVAIMLAYITFQYNKAADTYNALHKRNEEMRGDIKTLLSDNVELLRDNEKLIQDNKELIRINKELLNVERVTVRAVPVPDMPDEEDEPEQRVSLDPSKERLPEGHTNTFRCESYTDLNMPGSDQLKLQQECSSELFTGLRVYVDEQGTKYYCAALAGAYGSTIGDTWHVTLKCGSEFNIIFADYQHPNQITDADPNDFGSPDRNYDTLRTTEVIEFVADFDVMPHDLYMMGTMSYLDLFGGLYGDGGDIVKMEYLGKGW